MPRFFFDISDGSDIVDDIGAVFPTLSDARSEAIRTLTEIASERLPANGPSMELSIDVLDQHRMLLLRVRLAFSSQPEI